MAESEVDVESQEMEEREEEESEQNEMKTTDGEGKGRVEKEMKKRNSKGKLKKRERVFSWVSMGMVTPSTPGEEETEEDRKERRKHNWLVRWLIWEFQLAQGQAWKTGLLTPIGIETSPKKYFNKWKGRDTFGPPRFAHPWLHFWSVLGAFVCVSIVGIIQEYAFDPNEPQRVLLVGSFGATMVLLFAAPDAPLSQPRNVFFGLGISALAGVVTNKAILQGDAGVGWIGVTDPGTVRWLAQAVAVSSSILLMLLTKTLHAPGGATALLAIVGPAQLVEMGFLFVPFQMLVATIAIIIALIINNIPTTSRYPQYWW